MLELLDGRSCNRWVVVLEPLGEKLQPVGSFAGTPRREAATGRRPRWDRKSAVLELAEEEVATGWSRSYNRRTTVLEQVCERRRGGAASTAPK